MTPRPVVVKEVVERRVLLTRREQNREAWPTQCFDAWTPVYASDGTVQISSEMRANGVTNEYVSLLPKWMDFCEFNNGGGIWQPGNPGVLATADEVLDILDHLHLDSSDHLIVGAFNRDLIGHVVCSGCGKTFGRPKAKLKKAHVYAAAIHQAGDALRVIANFNGGLDGYLHALRRRNPNRWKWFGIPR